MLASFGSSDSHKARQGNDLQQALSSDAQAPDAFDDDNPSVRQKGQKHVKHFLSELCGSTDSESNSSGSPDTLEFTDDELSNLVYAFMACDLTSSGMVGPLELQASDRCRTRHPPTIDDCSSNYVAGGTIDA